MSRSESVKLWQERMQRFTSSQMTVAQFCLSEGVSQPTYYKWKKKLRELTSDGAPKPSTADAKLLPLRLTAAEPSYPVSPNLHEQPETASASTTIELPGGVRIHVEVRT